MAPLWFLRWTANPWLGKFFPGLLLGYSLKLWLDQELTSKVGAGTGGVGTQLLCRSLCWAAAR